jgi:trk system potassium uptake protein TrkH
MSNIEVIICLLLLFMAVPDVCRKLGRPALVFSIFVLFGILLGPLVNAQVATMLQQAGQVGFLLLLFEVGLEIDLPRLSEFARPLRRAASWAVLQYPVVFALAFLAGLVWLQSLVAAAALTACSVGMAHPAWKGYPGLPPEPKQFLLHVMVALEVMAIIVLAVETTTLKIGWSWIILLKLAGIAVTVFLIARFGAHLTNLFQTILERTTHWRIHWLVLIVLAICALGDRLGLDAAKTAFFLGLAMSRAQHDGLPLEEYIAPISHRFLIPIFFVALGMLIEWRMLLDWTALLAASTAALLLAVREILHRRWLKTGGNRRTFLLLCPNLTIVALAAKAMMDQGTDAKLTAWLVLTGLFMTIPSLLLLPSGAVTKPDSPPNLRPADGNRLPAPAAVRIPKDRISPRAMRLWRRWMGGQRPKSELRTEDQVVSLVAKPRRKEVNLRLVPLGFAALILGGAVLLLLPWAHQPGHTIGWLDALFLSTSATCVTGLTTVNVAETFSGFGQVVLLVLIQAGGLGIFTGSILLVLASGNRLSLSDEQTIYATVGRLRQARPLDVFIYACVFVLVFELAGTVALFMQVSQAQPELNYWRTLWECSFHSVSSFCNAGISIYPEGMIRWRAHSGVLTVVSTLVIAGGIGLMTLINLRYYYFWRRDPRRRGRLTLQTRLSIISAAVLLLLGAIAAWVFESHHTLQGATLGEQASWSFFHSAMSRTAGFNVVEVGDMNSPTLLATLVLMFIGGAPGSMAGGIKTVTMVVLLLTAWSALRRRDEVQFWNRRLPPKASFVATMLALFAIGSVVLGVILLMVFEDGHPGSQTRQHWLALVFEVVSAFGTVGLSTGVTSLLTAGGKAVIIVLMFVGRIAPLMLAVYLARPPKALLVRYPREELALG